MNKKKKRIIKIFSDLASPKYRRFIKVILATALGILICIYMLFTTDDIYFTIKFIIGFFITDILLLWITYNKWKYDEYEDKPNKQ